MYFFFCLQVWLTVHSEFGSSTFFLSSLYSWIVFYIFCSHPQLRPTHRACRWPCQQDNPRTRRRESCVIRVIMMSHIKKTLWQTIYLSQTSRASDLSSRLADRKRKKTKTQWSLFHQHLSQDVTSRWKKVWSFTNSTIFCICYLWKIALRNKNMLSVITKPLPWFYCVLICWLDKFLSREGWLERQAWNRWGSPLSYSGKMRFCSAGTNNEQNELKIGTVLLNTELRLLT